MAQGPLQTAVAVMNGAYSPLRMDARGNLQTSSAGTATSFNITAAAVVKATPGRVVRISVLVAGSAAGTVNDIGTTGAAAIGNQIGTIPNTVGVISLDWNCLTGIVVIPGTGQTLAISYQ